MKVHHLTNYTGASIVSEATNTDTHTDTCRYTHIYKTDTQTHVDIHTYTKQTHIHTDTYR